MFSNIVLKFLRYRNFPSTCRLTPRHNYDVRKESDHQITAFSDITVLTEVKRLPSEDMRKNNIRYSHIVLKRALGAGLDAKRG